MENIREYLKNMKITTFTIVKLAYKCDPIKVICLFAINVFIVSIQLMQIFVNALFLNKCITTVKSGRFEYSIIIVMLTVVLLMLLNEVFKVVTGLIQSKLTINMNILLSSCILKKIERMCYIYMEDSKSKDLIERISEKCENRIVSGLIQFVNLCFIIGKGIQICFVLASINFISILILLSCSCLIMYSAIRSGKDSYNVEREITIERRKANYLSQILTGKDYLNERNLFDYTQNINIRWLQGFNKYVLKQMKVLKKWYIYMKAQGVAILSISILVLIILLYPLSIGILTVGLFISIVNEIIEFSQMVTWDLSFVTEEIAKCKEFLKDLKSFFAYKEEMIEVISSDIQFHKLEFKNVWFKYPGTDKYILKGLNLVISSGYSYSLVGINGAGKSTIIKLMLGLYNDYEGSILLNGKNIHEYTQGDLCGLYATVFQDFNHYQVSLRDNLTMGKKDQLSEEDFDILRNIGLTEVIDKKLTNNIDLELGKITKESVDLSKGEWQKIAIARALISKKTVYIFDEPTASLDPISESDLYSKYKELCGNYTSILISHRLGVCRLVDKVYVLSDGKIIEEGTHDDLIKNNGVYSEMFKKQRGWYCEKEV